jgi:hypothetical protein
MARTSECCKNDTDAPVSRAAPDRLALNLGSTVTEHRNLLGQSMATAIIGALYSLGGLFVLTMRKWGAAIGVFFIGAEVLGRIYLVATGIAPSSGPTR